MILQAPLEILYAAMKLFTTIKIKKLNIIFGKVYLSRKSTYSKYFLFDNKYLINICDLYIYKINICDLFKIIVLINIFFEW
jgi:hypothetical protein